MTPTDYVGTRLPQDEEFDPNVGRLAMRKGRGPKIRSEAQVVADAFAVFKRHGGYVRKVHGGAHGNTGEPDLDAVIRGRAVKVEAKRIGNKPTGPQMNAMRRWGAVGALVGWFRTDGELEQILDHLTDVGFVPDLDKPGCQCPRHGTDQS